MKSSIISSIACALLIALSASPQTPVKPAHRIVVQMSEPQGPAWSELAVHVNNLLANLVPDGGAQIEIVFLGPGLNMLRKTNVAYEKRFEQFAGLGVTFAACQNSMEAMKLAKSDLFPFASEVRAGVAEIVRKQEAGWAYLH
jgi:intracellular sulfur oxidation DsrE/DsrF family protein